MAPQKTPELRPLNEEAAASNHQFIEMIKNAKLGPVMTPDEFKAWLNQE